LQKKSVPGGTEPTWQRLYCENNQTAANEVSMKKLLLTLPLVAMTLSACQTSNQNAAAGALGGAALGAAVSGHDDRLTGALVGAAVGVAASTLIGPAPQPNQCYYRNSQGQRYIAAC
jgi:hypothetical protein